MKSVKKEKMKKALKVVVALPFHTIYKRLVCSVCFTTIDMLGVRNVLSIHYKPYVSAGPLYFHNFLQSV